MSGQGYVVFFAAEPGAAVLNNPSLAPAWHAADANERDLTEREIKKITAK